VLSRTSLCLARARWPLARVFGLLLSLAFVPACAPTLSKPRGTEHLDALSEARTHQSAGRLQESADAYLQAAETAERKVDKDEALYRQSRVLARLGNLPEAIAICDQLGAEERIARRTLRCRLDAARYRMLAGEEERADADLRKLIVDEPDSAAAQGALRILVARHVDGVEDKEQALAYVQDLRDEIKPSSLGEPMMSAEAELLLQMGRKEEARVMLERQIERYPYPQGKRWDNALWQLADLALENENPKGAIEYLKQMVAVHETSIIVGSYTRPMMSKAALRIARIYRDNLRDNDAAIDAYREVRSEFPRSTLVDDALAEEAELRLALGDRDRGCDLLRELMDAHEVGSARRKAERRMASVCH
jgi:tetratricopeptide (TPR) repeat protein